jgi:hypothetical protein
MTGGFLGASAWPLMDIVAKGVLNLIAIAWMIRLAFRLAVLPDGLHSPRAAG